MKNTDGYRFAVMVLMFDCEKTILRMIENCGPYVEKIFITYSEFPWTYNKLARNTIKNSTDKEIIKASSYYSKIELIEGLWDTDEDQRNICLKKAKEEGFDFLIIQDADEFYTKEGYKQNIETIINNPGFDLYTTQFWPFWKNLHYVLVNKKGMFTDNKGGGFSEFAINCKEQVKFVMSRTTDAKTKKRLPGICYHLSYVHTNEEILKKISIWGHSHQFNRERWYKRKWLMWNEATRNLHPLIPATWKKAIYFEGQLPNELHDFKEPLVIQYNTNQFDRVVDAMLDFEICIKNYINRLFNKLSVFTIFLFGNK